MLMHTVTAVENFVSFQPNVQALVAGLTCMLAVLLSPQLRLHTFIPENATDRNSNYWSLRSVLFLGLLLVRSRIPVKSSIAMTALEQWHHEQ